MGVWPSRCTRLAALPLRGEGDYRENWGGLRPSRGPSEFPPRQPGSKEKLR